MAKVAVGPDQIPNETVEFVEKVRKKVTELRQETDGIGQFLRTRILPDGTVICTVGDSAITVGDYTRGLRMAQAHIAARIKTVPEVRQALVQSARLDGMKLTDVEKKAAIEACEIEARANGKTLDQMLEEQHITKEQLERQAYELVLANKSAFEDIERHIIIDLIRRRIFANAAIKEGLMKVAAADYRKMEDDPDPVIKDAQLTDEQTRAEFIEEDLQRLMQQRILNQAIASPRKTKNLLGVGDTYDQAIDQIYRSYEKVQQIRFSEIFVKAPLIDSPLGPSLQKSYLAANPQAKPEDLANYVKGELEKAKNKATWLMERARKGESFEELANKYSDLTSTREAKDGGDRGIFTESQLRQDENLYAALEKVQQGEVAPEILPTILGFHVLKVTKRPKKGTMTRGEVEDFVLQQLKDKIPDAACNEWLHEQYLRVPITVSPEFKKLMAGNTTSPGS